MRFLGLLLCLALMKGVLWLEGARVIESGDDRTSAIALLGLGFLLLASYLAGGLAQSVKLPRITGYLAVGALVGPQILGLVTHEMEGNLSIVRGLAVSLIALNAGGELNFGLLKKAFKEVMLILACESATVFLVIGLLVYFLVPYIESIPSEPASVRFALLPLIGLVALANSPMVAIAIINETKSKGPMSTLVLILSIFKDIFIILAFSVALEVARLLTSDSMLDGTEFAMLITRKIGGSIVMGILIGSALGAYVRRIGKEMPIVILTTCFFIAIIGQELHLKPLLIALAAGTFIENTGGDAGHRMIESIKRTSLPVYCLFFALAGVGLHLEELIDLGPVVVLLAVARIGSIIAGARIGANLAGSDENVKKYMWGGLISQAGLSLALASLISEAFEWGPPVATLLIAMIVINEMIGPIVFQWTLQKAGEAGKAEA